jgi:hypothetical protein
LTGEKWLPEYAAGDSVGQRIDDMATLIGGFDWDITPTSASALWMDVCFLARGSNRRAV